MIQEDFPRTPSPVFALRRAQLAGSNSNNGEEVPLEPYERQVLLDQLRAQQNINNVLDSSNTSQTLRSIPLSELVSNEDVYSSSPDPVPTLLGSSPPPRCASTPPSHASFSEPLRPQSVPPGFENRKQGPLSTLQTHVTQSFQYQPSSLSPMSPDILSSLSHLSINDEELDPSHSFYQEPSYSSNHFGKAHHRPFF